VKKFNCFPNQLKALVGKVSKKFYRGIAVFEASLSVLTINN
jgi:hypothetical protein